MRKKFGFSWFLLIVSCFFGLSIVGFTKVIDPIQSKKHSQKGGRQILKIAPAEPGLKSITFTAGNVPCKENNGIDVGTPHWLNKSPMPAEVKPTAVVKGEIMTTQLVFELPQAGPKWKGTVTILNVRYYNSDSPLNFISLNYTQPNPNTITIQPSGTASVSVSIGQFPNQVHRGAGVLIQCQLVEIPDPLTGNLHREPIVEGTPKVYEVYAAPTSPQASPWLGVLDYACEWADSQTASSSVSEYLTKGLNLGGIFIWVSPNKFFQGGNFKLRTLLNSIKPSQGNCEDVAAFLVICSNALGVNFNYMKHYCTDGINDIGWTTNNIKPIGGSEFVSKNWIMHAIAHPVGSLDVYDACAALELDYSGAFWGQAEYGWTISNYWQTGGYGLVNVPNPVQRRDSSPFSVTLHGTL